VDNGNKGKSLDDIFVGEGDGVGEIGDNWVGAKVDSEVLESVDKHETVATFIFSYFLDLFSELRNLFLLAISP
jgi:hypothetical protein